MKRSELESGDVCLDPVNMNSVLGWAIAQAEGGVLDPLVQEALRHGIYMHVRGVIADPAGRLVVHECGEPSCPDLYDGTKHFGCQISDLDQNLAGSGCHIIRPPAMTSDQQRNLYTTWRTWCSPGDWGVFGAKLAYRQYAWGFLPIFDAWLNMRAMPGPLGKYYQTHPPTPEEGSVCSLSEMEARWLVGAYAGDPRGLTPDDVQALLGSTIGVQVLED